MRKVYCFKKVLLIVQKDKYTNRPAYVSITMYVNVINNVIRSYFLPKHDLQTKKYKSMTNF